MEKDEFELDSNISNKKRIIVSISFVMMSLLLSLIAFIIVKNIPSDKSRLIRYFIYFGVSIVNTILGVTGNILLSNMKNVISKNKIISNLTTGIFLGLFFAFIFCLIPLLVKSYPFGSSLTLGASDIILMVGYYLFLSIGNVLLYIFLLQDTFELLFPKFKYLIPICVGILYALVAFFFNGSFGIYILFLFIIGLVNGYQRLLFKTQNALSQSSCLLAFYIFIMIIRLVLI